MEKRLNEAPCGFLTLNKQAEIVGINHTLCVWLGFSYQHLMGKHFEKLLSSSNRLMFHSYFYPTIQLKQEVEGIFIHITTANEAALPFLFSAKCVPGSEGLVDCFLMPLQKRIDYELELKKAKQNTEQAYIEKEQALRELQNLHEEIEKKQLELIEANAQLLALSNTDKLTGIANRRLFQQKLDEYIERFYQSNITFSLLLIDIDFFKKVNDTYGHLVGDIILKNLAQLLQQSTSSQHIVARYGGEEFAILLPDIYEEEAIQIAKALNRAVEQYTWPEIRDLTISIGAATYKRDYDADSIVEFADQALYTSKQQGRNRVTHYDQDIKNEVEK